ncbi:hypothetical protein MBLNU230_g2802t1 [Neophaeotheca triangularis]
MDEHLAKIVQDYCPPLDEALVFAIAPDFDLNNENGLKEVRSILDSLKADAEIEEAAGFDPSGSATGQSGSPAREEDGSPSSLADGVSSLSLSTDEPVGHDVMGGTEAVDALPLETKAEVLHSVLEGRISLQNISYTLRKSDGNFNRALEELLNHVYLAESVDEEDGSKAPTKGIDAFFEEHSGQRSRKGRKRNRRGRTDFSNSSPDSESPAPPTNRWKTAPEDIAFISDKSGIAVKEVSSMYHEQGASVSKTIVALIKASMDITKHVITDDEDVQIYARELGREFPTVKPEYLTALIRLTYPSSARAHELAKAMTAPPKTTTTNNGSLDIIPQYAPVNNSLLEGTESWQTAPGRKTRSTVSSQSPVRMNDGAVAEARRLATAAYNQAGMYRRRAGPDRLAAGYYFQEGREHRERGFAALSSNADAIAAEQSSASHVDLHGIDVLNAVRIAKLYVGTWWAGLGESRVNGRLGAADRSAGYGIVVGKGTHSEGGKGKLGPAISKMLRNEGWRFENNGAVLLVKGKGRA